MLQMQSSQQHNTQSVVGHQSICQQVVNSLGNLISRSSWPRSLSRSQRPGL